MATPTTEKVKAFLDRFGPKGKKILETAEGVEKEAMELGVAFKESDDTPEDELEAVSEKAKKPAKKPEKVALEIEVEEEDETEDETEEAEGEEEKVEMKKMTKKAETPVVEAEETPEVEAEGTEPELDLDLDLDEEDAEVEDEELEDEEFEEEKDSGFVMGNMTLKEYGDMMAEVFVEALTPVTEELEEVRKLLGRRKEADNLMLESQLEQGQAIEALQKQFDSIETTFKATRKTLSGLVDEQPKTVVKNFVASEAEETVITEDHRLKQAAPTADPLADFTKFVTGGNLS